MFGAVNERIQIHPEICHGKPVIRGTRVLVSVILGALAAGDSQDTILEDYPALTKADLAAALEFASQMTGYQEHAYHAAA
jgi:uncharacterized protein (DUF433 family)